MADEGVRSLDEEAPQTQTEQPEQAVELDDEPEPIPHQAIVLPPPQLPRAAPPPPAQRMIKETVTRKAEIMRPENEVLGYPAPAQRARYEVRQQNAKRIEQVLDNLLERPVASDYSLRIDRMHPFKDADGKRLTKLRNILRRGLMAYPELRETLLDLYGGGKYRVIIMDEQGEPLSNINSMQIEFPLDQYPAKDGEDVEEQTNGAKKPREEDSPDIAALKADTKRAEQMADLEEKKAAADQRRMEAETRRTIAQKRLEAMLLEASKPPQPAMNDSGKKDDTAVKLLEAQLKQAEDNRKSDNDRFAILMANQAQQMQTMITALATIMGGKKDDGGIKEMLAAMHANTTQVLTAVVNRPQDNSGTQILQQGLQQVADSIKTSQDANFKALEMVQKRDGSEAKNWMQMVQVLAAKNDGVGLRDLLTIIGQTQESERQKAETYMEMAARFAGMNTGEGEDEPAGGGFLDAAGRALLRGLNDLVRSAAQKPELLQTVLQIFGSRQPSPQRVVQVAQHLQNLPPAVGQQQLPMQPPVQPMAGLPPAVGMQPPYSFPPQLPTTMTQTTDQTTTMGVPTPTAAPQQGAASSEAALPSSSVQPPAAPPPPSDNVLGELAGVAAGFDAAAPAAPTAPPDAALDTAAEEHLRDAVSEVMEIALVETRNKPKRREWPTHADEKWPRQFLARFAAEPSPDVRTTIICEKCDPDLWARLEQVLMAEPEELLLFRTALDELVALQTQPQNAATAATAQEPPAPPPAAEPPVNPWQPKPEPPPAAATPPPPAPAV